MNQTSAADGLWAWLQANGPGLSLVLATLSLLATLTIPWMLHRVNRRAARDSKILQDNMYELTRAARRDGVLRGLPLARSRRYLDTLRADGHACARSHEHAEIESAYFRNTLAPLPRSQRDLDSRLSDDDRREILDDLLSDLSTRLIDLDRGECHDLANLARLAHELHARHHLIATAIADVAGRTDTVLADGSIRDMLAEAGAPAALSLCSALISEVRRRTTLGPNSISVVTAVALAIKDYAASVNAHAWDSVSQSMIMLLQRKRLSSLASVDQNAVVAFDFCVAHVVDACGILAPRHDPHLLMRLVEALIEELARMDAPVMRHAGTAEDVYAAGIITLVEKCGPDSPLADSLRAHAQRHRSTPA
ncbi:hypothetical protein [Amycolatopsis sp. CA-230715]|uniref:hypothetical protein n=1 Tax=Amycolatopsis sp. CA-230715 TaxID=2745196 RepID=UPI001C023164|nr:hypothetical protein [Amycolatopsis sp. CA-230715]QWF85791.1 hypothetical protein HUW46_09271 [Amycolatopsis sp. CA-230715]